MPNTTAMYESPRILEHGKKRLKLLMCVLDSHHCSDLIHIFKRQIVQNQNEIKERKAQVPKNWLSRIITGNK